MQGFADKVSFLWSVADLLRGDYKQSEYGRVILPFTVLRRLDQVLEPTREKVRAAAAKHAGDPEKLRDRKLRTAAGQIFYNTSKLDFASLVNAPAQLAQDLRTYVNGFSANLRDVVEHFRFEEQIERLDRANLLFLVVQKFAAVDLHPARVTNREMGYVFEELIRKFSEQSNETAGEHFTPREVIRLMVDLLFVEDDDLLRRPGVVRTLYDPACGTGGMLSVAQEYLAELNPEARLEAFGQEINGESYAICKADMMIKGQEADNIVFGNSFSEDRLSSLRADYLLSNPPFGVDWTKAEKAIREEHEQRGYAGRFGPGLPRKNDGALLFLLHMLSKMKRPEDGGSRLAIVFNGSPLFTGAAGSGESEIRRHLLEHDLLEAIVALPDQMFYNTGINTYVWIVTNRKSSERRGKVQLVDGTRFFQKMRKSLGDKRKELSKDQVDELTRLYHAFAERREVKIFDNEAFGYRRITVERPLRLSFQASPERVARLGETIKDAARLADAQRLAAALDRERVWMNRAAFVKDLKAAASARGVDLSAPLQKAVLAALGERDERAEICRTKGAPEPDAELRDYENVPLDEDVDAYLRREVLPHVPDAWVDDSKTKIGYEIPFTRHFYEYTPPRPLEEIEKEIWALEEEIRGLLKEALG